MNNELRKWQLDKGRIAFTNQARDHTRPRRWRRRRRLRTNYMAAAAAPSNKVKLLSLQLSSSVVIAFLQRQIFVPATAYDVIVRHASLLNDTHARAYAIQVRACRRTRAALIENNEASAKLTTANGGTFTWAQLDSCPWHTDQKLVPENWYQFLVRVSCNLVLVSVWYQILGPDRTCSIHR